ncbi:hypothetical protein [Litorilituus lipolyticus]|nr:hypothetical protein [Litorilituus lipolyticus]
MKIKILFEEALLAQAAYADGLFEGIPEDFLIKPFLMDQSIKKASLSC